MGICDLKGVNCSDLSRDWSNAGAPLWTVPDGRKFVSPDLQILGPDGSIILVDIKRYQPLQRYPDSYALDLDTVTKYSALASADSRVCAIWIAYAPYDAEAMSDPDLWVAANIEGIETTCHLIYGVNGPFYVVAPPQQISLDQLLHEISASKPLRGACGLQLIPPAIGRSEISLAYQEGF